MKLPKEYSGTTLLKGARAADPKKAQELAQNFAKGIPHLQNDDALNDLTEIIRNYTHEASDSVYIQNHKLRGWLEHFIGMKKAELNLVWKDVGVAHMFYLEHHDQVLHRIRGQITDAENQLSKLTDVPTHVKGDFLENGLILELLKFRNKFGLTTGHTNNSYSDSNNSSGSCVPWVQMVVNTLSKPLGKQFTNQAIKERVITIRKQNNELR